MWADSWRAPLFLSTETKIHCTSKALNTSACVGGHDANLTNCLGVPVQYESIPDDEIALLAKKFHSLHKFHKERRRSPSGCFECGDTTHFIADCPRGRSLTPPTSTTTPTRMTTKTKVTIRRRTTLETVGAHKTLISCANMSSKCIK
jgi:hypothetical protein